MFRTTVFSMCNKRGLFRTTVCHCQKCQLHLWFYWQIFARLKKVSPLIWHPPPFMQNKRSHFWVSFETFFWKPFYVSTWRLSVRPHLIVGPLSALTVTLHLTLGPLFRAFTSLFLYVLSVFLNTGRWIISDFLLESRLFKQACLLCMKKLLLW